jgi:chain length determinant protein (polysaccharide antigen chain regulator)
VSSGSVAVFTLDNSTEPPHPSTPIKPKKALIIVLGLVLGGMLGIFAALIRGMLAKRPIKAQAEVV